MSTEGAAVDPWARFGWLLGAVWLVFLAFPVSAAITADRPPVWRALCLVLVAVFALVYVHGMWVDDNPDRARLSGPAYLGVLGLLTAATVPVLGDGALGLIPFVLAMAGITLPARAALGLLGLAMLLVVALWWGLGAQVWIFLLIYPMVTATLVLVRTLDDAGSRRQEATRALEIAGERDRVARDVHDVLGHSLTVVTVKAELAERLVDTDPERAKREMAELRSITRQSLAEIRATVAGLRVVRLTDELESARTTLAGAGIDLTVRGDPAEVDPRHRIVLAWALREAVTNVVRHSGATRVEVDLGPDRLTVRDDGRGLSGAREGNGLSGLRERVEPSGGVVTVAPADPPWPSGTTVGVQL